MTSDAPDWAKAACRDMDVDLWFREADQADTRLALSTCSGCEIRIECLEAAMDEEKGKGYQMRHGIRGGLTKGQRHDLAASRRKAARAAAAA
ncbi:WhiB family transcriptional regulator [Streptomyces odonnellii]|uniref:WhiB family transcriptional regulator n=1 Tax=Streptomyces odonnellii TaxID=1417980 RepID=UPI0006257791|nr:WhiB family transcriptional regulator [Streptomyces odonnellii]